MSADWLYGTSEVLILVGMLAMLVLAAEVGYRAGARAVSTVNDVAKPHLGTISSGILGLLALLLGFTFAMSLSRYDLRKRLVTEEANAIGNTYLRAQLLPAPENEEIADLLRKYVNVRLHVLDGVVNQSQLDQVNTESENLQREIWTRLPSAIAKDGREVTTGLFHESVSKLFDLENERLAAMENHVPENVLILLMLVASIAVLCIGYSCGIAKTRHLFSTSMLIVLLVLVITVIIDLDRPRRGMIKISQASMIRLQSSMQRDVP